MSIDQYMKHVRQLMELRENYHDLQAQWYRRLLTLASGGLALLAGLGPRVPADMGNTGKIALACTWVFLGIGIISGSATTFLEVNRAKVQAELFRKKLISSLHDGTVLQTTDLAIANPKKIYLYSKNIMIGALLLAVCSLVLYAILATMSV